MANAFLLPNDAAEEQTHSAEKRVLHRQRKSLRLWDVNRQTLLKCQPVSSKGFLVYRSQLSGERNRIATESIRVVQRRYSFLLRVILRINCSSLDEK